MKGTPTDDLQPGDFVAVVEDTGIGVEYQDSYSPKPVIDPIYDGIPLEIIAISLPFLCVSNGRRRFGLDIRRYHVKKVNNRYAKEMQDARSPGRKQRKFREEGQIVFEEDTTGCCPRCHVKMIQTVVKGEWVYLCKHCHFNGGPAVGSSYGS